MSQFRVQKVTKVKGPSELTGKASGDSTTKKTRSSSANTDRPQTPLRQKKSSTPKSAEAKNSSSSGDKQNASAPRARNRPTAAKRTTTAKTCPSQQGKKTSSPQTASKHSRSNADVNDTKSVPPKPSTKPRKESPPKKSPPLEKESSYDASESESDEHELSGKLSPKDDIGYETGSYDEIDASNSETTTPDAGQENKTILNQNREIDSAGYSYAVDFRPLIVAGDVGISTPIHTTHPDKFEVESSNDLFGNHSKERLSYAYASNEFRPLIITDEGGFSAPLDTNKSSEETHGLSSLESKRPPMRYEEVEIHSGKFDRTNVNVVQLNTVSSETNTAVENDDTTCSAVNDQDLNTPLNRTDQNPNGDQIGEDVYAVVQKDNKSAVLQNNSICAGETIKPEEFETPPEIPSRKDITRSDVYECITGELQNMIQACNEDDKNGDSFCPGSNSVPPPLPKPYAGSGVQPATAPDTCEQPGGDDWDVSALYAEVQKKPKEKTYKLENTPGNQSPDDIPPPIPSRCNLDDTLGKEATPPKTGQDKDQKSGFGIFNIMHRRKLSDGNVVAMSGERCKSPPKKGHKRSKSQDCISNNFDNLTKDSGNLIKAYLEVDITDPPHTPRDMQSVQSYWEDGDDQYMDGELPEGWKEVESENGSKYYWHVSSGTTQWEKPQVAPRPKKKMQGDQLPPAQVAEKQKVLSFPVHSMGWIELEETQVAPHNMSDTIADCISTLAKSRKDLWQTSETWGEGKDIRLLLEGDTLKLVEPRNKIILLVQPVSKMRVWGVGKEDHRDFAYVARDPNTSKHKCHMFRCHGNISGRAITTALHEMCNKILQEKKRAQEISKKASQAKPWSDIINTPAPLSAKDSAGFNEKPVREQRKDFTATYLGCSEVPKPTGMEMLNKAIHKVASKNAPKRTVLIQVTVSCIKLTDCTSQEEISEDRVRYLSFMGIGKDERLCGYIMANEPDRYLCHVFQCSPNAASLTKALEEACQLRYQKCLDAHPEMATRPVTAEQEPDKTKDKVPANFMSSVQGLLGKLGPKKGGKKDDVLPSPPLPKPSHTFMVKYYGALPVAVGTGVETVEEAAKHLTGGTLLICQLDVAINGVTLYDSQRSSLSRRHMDADTISFCGLTSDNGHFGLIQCQGGGKYVCHVFSEYKTKAAPIVAAIHETL